MTPGEPDVRPLSEKLYSRALIPANTVYLALCNLIGEQDPLTLQADETRQALARRIESLRAPTIPKKRK